MIVRPVRTHAQRPLGGEEDPRVAHHRRCHRFPYAKRGMLAQASCACLSGDRACGRLAQQLRKPAVKLQAASRGSAALRPTSWPQGPPHEAAYPVRPASDVSGHGQAAHRRRRGIWP